MHERTQTRGIVPRAGDHPTQQVAQDTTTDKTRGLVDSSQASDGHRFSNTRQ